MRRVFVLALALIAASCGGTAPAPASDAGSDMSTQQSDLGIDMGGATCECTSGPCCDGCDFRPAGIVCGYSFIENLTECTLIGTDSRTWKTGRAVRCSGASATCDTMDVATSDVVFDCVDNMCPGVNCAHGCSSGGPDCSIDTRTGCYAPQEVSGIVCAGHPYLGY